jgi:hypothetical protein
MTSSWTLHHLTTKSFTGSVNRPAANVAAMYGIVHVHCNSGPGCRRQPFAGIRVAGCQYYRLLVIACSRFCVHISVTFDSVVQKFYDALSHVLDQQTDVEEVAIRHFQLLRRRHWSSELRTCCMMYWSRTNSCIILRAKASHIADLVMVLDDDKTGLVSHVAVQPAFLSEVHRHWLTADCPRTYLYL